METPYNIHPQINNLDVDKYTTSADDKLEEHEFRFRLMTTQNNGPYELDIINSELKNKMQEQEMNQSGWSMQKFV